MKRLLGFSVLGKSRKIRSHLLGLGLLNPLNRSLLTAGLLSRIFLNLSELLFIQFSYAPLLIVIVLWLDNRTRLLDRPRRISSLVSKESEPRRDYVRSTFLSVAYFPAASPTRESLLFILNVYACWILPRISADYKILICQ